jgi:hypothetical protein
MASSYFIAALGTILFAGISAAFSMTFNPPTVLFMQLSTLLLKQLGREPSGWASGTPYILVSLFWPLSLVPLHILNFKLLRWGIGGYTALFICTGLLFSFILLISKSNPLQLSAYNLESLAARFRQLRYEAESTPNERRSESQQKRLSQWGGEFHGVMAEVGLRLKAERCSEEKTLLLMGAPNEILADSQSHAGETVPSGEKWLLYNWRGGHDRLILVLTGGIVSDSRWYFAGE